MCIRDRHQFLCAGAAFSDRAQRDRPEIPCEYRTEYQRDRDRILHCKSFRRLKHKTQVFLSPEGDHYRDVYKRQMENLFHDMASLNLQNRKVALIGNGSWAPASAALMKKRLEGMKNMTLIGQPLESRSSLKQEQADELEALANAIASSVKETRI